MSRHLNHLKAICIYSQILISDSALIRFNPSLLHFCVQVLVLAVSSLRAFLGIFVRGCCHFEVG